MNRNPGYWPPYLPRHLVKPETTLVSNLEVAALRHGDRAAVGFMGTDVTYAQVLDEARRFAGWLQAEGGVKPGDRVLVTMQNAPHWLMAYYGVLIAEAVVVPANPMYKADELAVLLEDSGAAVVVCAAELVEAVRTSAGPAVRRVVVARYADYLPLQPAFDLPAWVTQPAAPLPEGCVAWTAMLAAGHAPRPSQARPDDLALINYTSGSTGRPKGCMHTHRTLMHTTVGLCTWHAHAPGTPFLGVVPMYQVGGLMVSLNCAVYAGGTIVPVPRWERRLVVALIKHYQIRYAGIAPTALIDLLADPALEVADLASLGRISFGGASMPDSVWQTIRERLGLEYVETYGMTETAATSLINPIGRLKRGSLGVPFFDTEVRILDTETQRVVEPGTAGEIAVHGPQLFKGYWGQPEATAESFIEIDGKTFFRSGDIGHEDEEGYFFMTDRLKRMINASGFKVWPAEVEATLFGHPAIREVCVVGVPDSYRGETVKAVVVLKQGHAPTVADITDWARSRLAAFKVPRQVEFVAGLPKSPVGKVLWRELQEAQVRQATEEVKA